MMDTRGNKQTQPRRPREKKVHSISVRMSDWLRDGLEEIAHEDGRSISNLAGKILEDWLLAYQEKQAKDASDKDSD